MSLQGDGPEKITSPLDISHDVVDSEPDGKTRAKTLRAQKKFSSPSRIR